MSTCKDCKWWEWNSGVLRAVNCTNSYVETGYCHLEVKAEFKYAHDFCSHYIEKGE